VYVYDIMQEVIMRMQTEGKWKVTGICSVLHK